MPTRYPIFIVDASSILSQAYKNSASKTCEHPDVYTFCKILIKIGY